MNSSDIDIINKGALDYLKSVSPNLRDIVKPFFSQTGLTHFSYTRYLEGQRYMTLSLDTDMAQDFFKYGMDRYMIPTGLHIGPNSKREVFWDLLEDNENLVFLRKFGYGHGLSIFVRHEDVVESWHFAPNKNTSDINQFYMYHKHLIDKFIVYFQEKAKNILCPNDLEKMAVFRDGRCLDIAKVFEDNQHGDLQELVQVSKYPFIVNGNNVCLSKSEFDCLLALFEGLCVKAVARRLGKSPRTVESHIINAKIKLCVSSRGELLKMLKYSVYSKIFR